MANKKNQNSESKRTVNRQERVDCPRCENKTTPSKFITVKVGEVKHKLCPTCVRVLVEKQLASE